jgi:streptogramin lyase
VAIGDGTRHDFALVTMDKAMAIHQLPANEWFSHVEFPDPALRAEFAIQCAMCHQQGSAPTRIARPVDQWRSIFERMNAMGATLTPRLREEAPKSLNAAYRFEAASRGVKLPGPVVGEAAQAVVTEWEVGKQTSFLHDIVVGPGERIYAVDWILDKLWTLDPATNDRREFDVPRGDVPPGGILRSFAMRGRQYYHSVPHIAPHSVQIGPSGDVWITLCLGRGLARFDPATGKFSLHDEPSEGLYPHTLRFDRQGRIWYTIAMSNHVARYDPASDTFTLYRLPTRTLGERFFVSTLRFWIWAADKFHVMDLSTSDPELLPIAYGIDVAPEGGIWFSQFNHRRIGRLDPVTGAIRMIDTPFYGPRRLRFDSKGILWIPAYAEGRIYRFDPRDESFRPYDLPTGRGDMPYALAVDKRTDTLDLRHELRFDHPLRAGDRAVHRLPAPAPGHLHARDRRGRGRERLDEQREHAGLADRGRTADGHPLSPRSRAAPPREAALRNHPRGHLVS